MKILLLLLSVHLVFSADLLATDYHLVLFGGFNSCGWGTDADGNFEYDPYMQHMYPYFVEFVQDFIDEVGPDDSVQTTTTCYNDTISTIHGVYLKNSTTILKGTFFKFEEIQKYFDEQSNRDAKLVLVAHSYGGWLGMKLFQDGFTESFQSKQLFTIDPISVKECYWWTFAIRSAACHRAPQDIRAENIRDSVDYWANYFQRDHTWLNSSEIPMAHQNKQMHYAAKIAADRRLRKNKNRNNIVGHNRIDVDPRVWGEITAIVKKSL